MATLNFAGPDFKVFTPVSSALGALSNGAGTMVVLLKQTTAVGGNDFVGLMNAAGNDWFHTLCTVTSPANALGDDDGTTLLNATTAQASTTTWNMFAVDWPSGGAALERVHYRNQTGAGAGSPGSWAHENTAGNNGGNRAGPGTGGWLRIGWLTDFQNAKDMAIVAIWAGTRFADADYTDFRKTSDLYSHSKGAPSFLCELTATTLVDLIGGSTYSSANSSGTTLTGSTPDNWTFDGIGSGGGSTVTAVVADGLGDAPNPVINAGSNVTAPVADATGASPAPANRIDVEIVTGPASATGDAPVPTVSAGTNASVSPPAADGTGAAPVPSVQAGANPTTPVADGTGTAPAPTVTGNQAGQVNPPAADSQAAAPAPVIHAGQTVSAPVADALGDAPVPTGVGQPVTHFPGAPIGFQNTIVFPEPVDTRIAAFHPVDTVLAAAYVPDTELAPA